jgi:transcriptional regulator with XRE-family HTH domain
VTRSEVLTVVKNVNPPNPIDVHVGARIKLRRIVLNIGQEPLAQALGLTFQQVQKYELGANRVSASKLYAIARFLEVPVAYFFEDLAGEADDIAEDQRGSLVRQLLRSSEGVELAAAYSNIESKAHRRALLDLARALSA